MRKQEISIKINKKVIAKQLYCVRIMKQVPNTLEADEEQKLAELASRIVCKLQQKTYVYRSNLPLPHILEILVNWNIASLDIHFSQSNLRCSQAIQTKQSQLKW